MWTMIRAVVLNIAGTCLWTALCFVAAWTPFAAAAENEIAAIARGGRLYDDWAKELGATVLYRIESSRETDSLRPGRCVSCHGWDYRGENSVAGRADPATLTNGLQNVKGGDTDRVAGILIDERHGYADYLNAEDRKDLALFLVKGQVAMDMVIDERSLRAKGEAAKGHIFFQTICANCHGNDGQQIVESQPLGDVARGNPWQALHTLMNGHPGGTMPALRALDNAMLLDTLAFVQTLPPRNVMTSVVRGGRLYDTWYKENGQEAPKDVHPAYPEALPQSINARTTWRCKECHGWDYRGRDGVYGQAEHRTGIVGIQGMADADPATIAAKIQDEQHAYGKLLSPRDVADLANFVARGQLDMDIFIDRETFKARGDATAYVSHYHTICSPCHGPGGREVRTMPPLGRIAADDPWRALHGILNGHPGEPMPPLIALPHEAAVGILAYIQTLPRQKAK